jgi:hypothetical protein
MKAGIPSWWYLISAARAALIYLGSKRLFVLVIEAVFAVAALRAYRAPEGKRWAAIRSQWILAIRDVFIVIFSIGVAVFGYELMWNQPNQSRLRQAGDFGSNPSALFDPIPASFSSGPTNLFPPLTPAPSVFRFFCRRVSRAAATSYLTSRSRPHHRFFTTTALLSVKALTIPCQTAPS